MFFQTLSRELKVKTSFCIIQGTSSFAQSQGRIFRRKFFSEKIIQLVEKAFAANTHNNYLWDSRMSRIPIKAVIENQKKPYSTTRTIKSHNGTIEFKRLTEIDKSEVIDLLNNPLVRRHMPLAKDLIDDAGYESFLSAKEETWSKHGYGPWACLLNGKFIGWAGFQPEQDDVEIALVLHPNYWGNGKPIYMELFRQGFEELGFSSIIVLFPPSRTRIKALFLLGFVEDGEVMYDGEKFLRYRLHSPLKKKPE